ncbi:MAG: terpene cyclase/mutase family protein [Planctomycetota bacterium]|nr:terpene cyclase/mutase family protein [Planctomycetota bacterium]MDA1113337.1 terpene cyclase/mutase family protein [Planctomycetota bacterium]
MFLFPSLALALLCATPCTQEPTAKVELGPWLVMGPFAQEKPDDLSLTHPPERFLKNMLPGEYWLPAENGVEVSGKMTLWKPATSTKPRGKELFDVGQFDLVALTGEAKPLQAAYLYCAIQTDLATEETIFFGSDDGLRMWLNGALVCESTENRGTNAYQENVTLSLEPGINHLMVKVTQNGGTWKFEMQSPRFEDQAAINLAVDRGVQYMLGRQLLDGSWQDNQDTYRNGATALTIYALLSSGLDPRHPAILRGLEYLRTEPSDRTYSAGCELMALAALDDPSVFPWIEERAEDLISWQEDSGQWAYPGGHWDLSCTQFAILGLRAAAQRGVDIPRNVWDEAVRGTLVTQAQTNRKTAGEGAPFIYYPGHPTGWSGTMTSAGISVLAIAKEQLGERIKRTDLEKIDASIESGLLWLGQQFSLGHNPGRPGRSHYYYWLYGVERVGALLHIQKMGDHDWYQEGASFLVEDQGADGQWSTPWGEEDIATSFALLFLKRATARSAITGGLSENTKRHHETPTSEDHLVLHAISGDPMVLWVVPPKGVTLLNAHYFARRKGAEWLPAGDGEGNRFGYRFSADTPGAWEFQVKGESDQGKTWESTVLTMEYETGIRVTDMQYASDSSRNLLPAYRPEVSISTQHSDHSGTRLVDNVWYSFWDCDISDTSPTVEIKLRKKAKVDRILLSQAHTRKSEQGAHPHVAQIELWLNKDKEPTIYQVETSPARKTIISFEKTMKIDLLKIVITEIEGGVLGNAIVGFSEIEFQRD